MNDNSHFLPNRDGLDGARTATMWRDGGIEAARALRITALLSIAARLFYIYACANRISLTHTVLGLVGADGLIDTRGRTDGGAGLVIEGREADSLVNIALIASLIVFVLYFLAMISLLRRRKRDALAAAIDKNRAVRLAGRLYVVAAVASVIARSVLNPSPDAAPVDRLHTVLDVDTTTIGLQIALIAILLLIALATGREIDKARAGGRIG